MNKYMAKDNDKLDMICFKNYGSLDQDTYSNFLRENEHLLTKFFLSAGDIVNLPGIEPKIKKERYLWE